MESQENSRDMDIDRMAVLLIILLFVGTLPARTVHCFPNNKPSITNNIKVLLNQKKQVFREEDREKMKHVQHELKKSLKQAKLEYKKKVAAAL